MKRILLLSFTLLGFLPLAYAQLNQAWSPFRIGRQLFQAGPDTAYFLDGYILEPGYAEAGDSVWPATPMPGTQRAYGNAFTFYCYLTYGSGFGMVGEAVRWIPSRRAFRLILSSECSPSSCRQLDTTYWYPDARLGQIAVERTFRSYSNTNRYQPYRVLNQYPATIMGRSDSVREIGDSTGRVFWRVAKQQGLWSSRMLNNSDTTERWKTPLTSLQRLPLLSARRWLDLRPGDRLDRVDQSDGTGHPGNIYYNRTDRTRIIQRVLWSLDSSQVRIVYREYLYHLFDSAGVPGNPRRQQTDSVDLQVNDYAFAEPGAFFPFYHGLNAFYSAAQGWSWKGKNPNNGYFPGNFDSTTGGCAQTFPFSSGWSRSYVYMQTAVHGTWGTPLILPTRIKADIAKGLQVHPTPAHAFLTVAGAEGRPYILFSTTGNRIAQGNISAAGVLDRGSTPTGLYILQVHLPDGWAHVRVLWE